MHERRTHEEQTGKILGILVPTMPVHPKKTTLRLFAGTFKPAFELLKRNDPMRLAGATAFFTTFALPPIIFLIANLFGLFFGRRNMGRGLLDHLSNILGEDGVNQLRQVIRSIRGFDDSWYVIVGGCLFLFFVATTLFMVIKNTFNQLWKIQVDERPGILFLLGIRLKSFGVILFVGVLFFADLLLESLEGMAGYYVDEMLMGSGNYFRSITSELISIFIVSAWFIVLFRYLADARPTWRACVTGGLVTGVLFTIGRFLLGILLVDSNIGAIYGPAGSLVLVLLFVFYSSFILYFGASFIAAYSERKGWAIRPNDKASHKTPASLEK